MIRCIEPGALEAWDLAAWMVILEPAAWRLGEAGSLDADGNDDECGDEMVEEKSEPD